MIKQQKMVTTQVRLAGYDVIGTHVVSLLTYKFFLVAQLKRSSIIPSQFLFIRLIRSLNDELVDISSQPYSKSNPLNPNMSIE